MTQIPHRFSKSTEVQNLAGQLNENFDIIDQHFDKINPHPFGRLVLDVSGDQNVALTAEQARNAQLVFTGTLTADISVILPNNHMVYHVQNLTSGDYTLTIKTGAGNGVLIQQASLPNYPRIKRVLCDGSNIVWADGSQIVEDNLHEENPTHGYYVRYANGMQVCYKNVVGTVDVNIAWGSLFRSSGILLGQFAQPFLDGTRPSINISLTGGTSYGIISILTGVTHAGMGGVNIINNTAVTGATFTISVTAIGRWK